MDSIETVAEALQNKQRRCKAARAVNMAVYAAAVALFFVLRFRPMALTLMVLGLFLHFFVVRQMTETYKVEAAQANLCFGLCGKLTDFTYDPKGGMSYKDFCSWGLAPIRNEQRSLLCRNGFTAKDGNLLLAGQEATFHYNVPNSHGKENILFLSGALLTAGIPGRGGWLFLRPNVLSEAAITDFLKEQGYETSPNAPEGWELYEQAGAPGLSESLMAHIKNLEKSVSILRLTESGAAGFLNGRFYVGARYPSTQPTAQLLQENTLAERDSLWAVFRQWLG